ncbi:MAG: CpaF family protein [Oligoflexia bacterium]|nr:CpaF family protein [Oligoflexia bacterium]
MSGDTALSVFEAAIQSFLGPILPYLKDETVTEVMINGPKEIFIERKGKIIKVEAAFNDEDSLQAAVHNIAQSVGRRINDEKPTLDARLPDGSRIHAVFPPCARNGTTVSIRKFSKTKMTFPDYIKFGAITIDSAQFLDICMFLGKNIIVSGGTGSGKTTLLGLLSSRVPPGQRVIVIEDASELMLEYEHVVHFETRMADEQGKGIVSMSDLLKSSLRLRPDRIIVGEVRGAEAIELINAMNTGHKGCLGTVHANNPSDSMVRLETLAMSGDARVSELAIRSQLASAVQIVVQISRFSDGGRRISHISEVRGLNSDKTYNVVDIYHMSPMKREADGRLTGGLLPTGEVPTFVDEIENNRIPFNKDKFNRPRAA